MTERVENAETKHGMRSNFHAGQVKAWQPMARIVAMVSGTESGKGLPFNTLIPTPLGLCPSGFYKPKGGRSLPKCRRSPAARPD